MKGAIVNVVYLPAGPNGKKVGVDDYLLSHSVEELQALIQAPKPEVKAAPPIYELLDDAPAIINRPLQLIGEQAYVATWAHVRTTITERLDEKTNQIVRLSEPFVTTERQLVIVRDDGSIFGESAQPVEELGLQVKLNDPPRDDKLWRASAIKRYRTGYRPDVSDVFSRMCSVYDKHIDFNRSFADQQTMCKLSACFSLATWFASAFTVIGYPWPNGEKGSGKTQWGTIWTLTSYLGELVTMGGSFAALRDCADYGSTLFFDEAENVNDPKRVDPDKRAILLAGNRKGVRIPLKESQGDRWVTRWVDCYGPRGFASIALPDPVLHSRSVVVSMVRTADPQRGNADPANTKRWPCGQRELQDDLWAMALWLLPEAERIWAELDDEINTFGREFEPWRCLVAVARLAERHGVAGLEQAIKGAMEASLSERSDVLGSDWTRSVILTLVRYAEAQINVRGSDVSDVKDVSDVSMREWTFSASEIAKMVTDQIKVEEGEDGETAEWVSAKRIGWILKGQRLKNKRASDKKRSRHWNISLSDVVSMARSYGVRTLLSDMPTLSMKTSEMPKTSETSESNKHDVAFTESGDLLSLASERGWPQIELRQGSTIGGSEERWRVFVNGNRNGDLSLAQEKLEDLLPF